MDIAELLAFSVKNKASDLHLSAGLPPMIRVDGDVRRINIPALDHKQVHALVYDIMSDKQRRDFEEFLEVDFSFEIPGLARFRVNAFNQNRGAGAVFRTIPSQILSLEELAAPKIFAELINQPQGLILVTGPTGSGKSTTLAAMVDHINKNEFGHILTVEDPIEFVHTSQKCLVNQREVHRDTHGFNEALRSALREDPDYILVGEMRDLETIRLALTAAETGHLVFGTLHTSSAAKTIDRIIDVFPAGESRWCVPCFPSRCVRSFRSRCSRRWAAAEWRRTRSWWPRRPSVTSSARTRSRRCIRPSRPASSTACRRSTSACRTSSSVAWSPRCRRATTPRKRNFSTDVAAGRGLAGRRVTRSPGHGPGAIRS